MERAHGKAEITFQQWRVRPSCGKVGEPIRVGGLLPGSDADGSNRPRRDIPVSPGTDEIHGAICTPLLLNTWHT